MLPNQNRTFGGGAHHSAEHESWAASLGTAPPFDGSAAVPFAAAPTAAAATGGSAKSEIERLRLEMSTQRREYERRLADLELEKARAEAELTQLRAHNTNVQGSLDGLMAQRTKDSRDRTDSARQLEELRGENLRLRKELSAALESKLAGLRTPAVSLEQYRQLLQITEQLMTALNDGGSGLGLGSLAAPTANGVAAARAWIDTQQRGAAAGPSAVGIPPLALSALNADQSPAQPYGDTSGLSRAASMAPADSISIAAGGRSAETPRASLSLNNNNMATARGSLLLPGWGANANDDAATTIAPSAVGGMSSALGSVSARESVSQAQALKRQSAGARAADAPPAVVREELVEKGKLAKLITDANPGKQWAFHNATPDTQYILDFTLGPQSEVVPLGDTEVSEGRRYRITLYPGETKDFIRGVVNGYRMSIQYGEPDSNYVRASSITDSELLPVIDRVRELRAGTVDEAVRLCVAKGLDFVDVSFPPLSKSMARANEGPGPAARWERTSDLHVGEKLELCAVSGFDAGGPIREVPNGWLASAMVVLAPRRTEIIRCFARTSQVDQAAGLYRVTLSIGGWWQTINVDSFVPCATERAADGSLVPYGCRCRSRRDVWPTVLEKATAKLFGSYAALATGDPLECMMDISGGIAERLDWRGRDGSTFSAFLKTFRHNVCLLLTPPETANTPDSERGRSNTIGCRPGQAYHVLAAVHCEDFRLCLISNPEGADAWKGAWSNTSEFWVRHPAVKAACDDAMAQAQVQAVGAHWMEWREVSFHFGGAGLLKLRPSWLDVRIVNRFHGVRPMWIIELSVRKPSGIIIGVHQKDRRLLDANDPDRAYSAFLITCVAANENGVWDAIAQSHGGTFWRGRDVHLEMALAPRDRPYYILPRRYTEDRDRDTVVSVQIEQRDGVSMVLKQPTEEIMNSVRYSPVWKFDPAPCPIVQPTPRCQVDRQDVTSLAW